MMVQRRGVVDGVDFGATGEVKKIDVDRICERLDGGSVVLLRNLGHSSSGEVLNCKYALSLSTSEKCFHYVIYCNPRPLIGFPRQL